MKTLIIIGKSLKIAFYIATLAILGKLALVYYYGYRKVDLKYGGPYFYYWSVKFVDKKLPKSYYTNNSPNDQAVDKRVDRYIAKVQPPKDKKAAVQIPYPFYSYGHPDSFVLGPKKTWRIFENDAEMDLEFRFLECRGRFIMMSNDLDYNKAHGNGHSPVSIKYFKPVDRTKLDEHFSKEENAWIPHTLAKSILNKMETKEKDYGVRINAENKAVMTKSFETDVLEVVKHIAPKMSISVNDLNEFWGRVCAMRMTPRDVHIVNRIKLYMFYIYSYMDVSNCKYKEYDDIAKKVNDLKAAEDSETNKRVLENSTTSMYQIRMELILNKVSALFAGLLGDMGHLVDKTQSNWLVYFGAPYVATKKSIGDVRGEPNFLDNQLISAVESRSN